ncbi:hypothetical protein IAQ61_003592 [Plenodomus lingam]|uniref:Predicted protein n=1 Tax=Leptosphaeria maculans (strain JN3 / isolate v23.1.3 / race Av1-4-5-6-7-8) TaxID=985895 RepID=E4ZR39_LEPMJ|nr:predicted protein [Plenodomus lingam JN3]KAH9874403.1 hypothetical protein IAQ61_003592 [Plenodomus lingam]CBX93704.1 predicted protein [Plenodomus lingam JN3]
MSSPTTQYVYIPNLVGRQMLRIPLDEVEAEGQITLSSDCSTMNNTTSSTYSRGSSPSPSLQSVESVQSNE